MKIRHTRAEDLDRAMEIYASAREWMKQNGNPDQWSNFRPTREEISRDIQNRNSYVLEQDGNICGVFSFLIGKDPTYETIEGKWKNDEEYGVIHRLASNGKVRGVFAACLEFCESRIGNLRIDTHRDNIIMRRLIQKNGFEECGIIRIADGSLRIAYQKTNAKDTT